jgi:hypothetical protein
MTRSLPLLLRQPCTEALRGFGHLEKDFALTGPGKFAFHPD